MIPGFQIIIEGQSGAGKTPLISSLKDELESRGYNTLVCAPFALANDFIKQERPDCKLGIYNLWHESTESALFAMNLLIGYMANHARMCQESNSIALFDRGWLTICMGLAESVLDQDIKKSLISQISENPPATFFLDTLPEITQSRNSWRAYIPWTNENIHSDFEIRRYFIENCNNLLGRHLVDASRIDLRQLASIWSDKIEASMLNTTPHMSK